MAKQIEPLELLQEMADYFNDFIIPNKEMTIVETATVKTHASAKGPCIVFTIRDSNCGPTYYASAFMDSIKEGRSIQALSEMLNVEIMNQAEEISKLGQLAQEFIEVSSMTEADPIVSIIQTSEVPENYTDEIYRKDTETGMTLFMKAPMCKMNGSTLYNHVKIDNSLSESETERLWDIAIRNTYMQTPVGVGLIDGTPMMQIIDQNQFTALFYTCFDDVYRSICEEMDLAEIYIIPESPFSATLFAIPMTDDTEMVEVLCKLLGFIISDYLAKGSKDKPPVLKYNAEKHTISLPEFYNEDE